MGSSIGAAAAGNGHEVLWASAGRGPATRDRAEAEGLADAGTLSSLVDRSEVIVSVCPPAAAADVAQSIGALGFGGVYLDANATSPDTARRVADIVANGGASFVDGGIIGPPARTKGLTLLYLSGEPTRCDEIAALFEGSPADVVVLDRPAGAASATKMAFAAWTKGSSALLLAVRALAEHEGVVDGLEHAWAALAPDLPARVAGTAAGIGPKAWRFEGEMHEIAATFSAAGLPDGFHEAAAAVYGALADLRDHDDVTLADVLARLGEPLTPS
jgi:3-hydroxyisobutyrate dehydrogenase-like beta-hydroxyacid dehydrogenase